MYFVFALFSFHVPTSGLCANNVPANANSAIVEISLCKDVFLGPDYSGATWVIASV